MTWLRSTASFLAVALLIPASTLRANSLVVVYFSPLGGSTQIVDTFTPGSVFKGPTSTAVDLVDDSGQLYYTSSSFGPVTVKFKSPNNAGRWEVRPGGEFKIDGRNVFNTRLTVPSGYSGPCLEIKNLLSEDRNGDASS